MKVDTINALARAFYAQGFTPAVHVRIDEVGPWWSVSCSLGTLIGAFSVTSGERAHQASAWTEAAEMITHAAEHAKGPIARVLRLIDLAAADPDLGIGERLADALIGLGTAKREQIAQLCHDWALGRWPALCAEDFNDFDDNLRAIRRASSETRLCQAVDGLLAWGKLNETRTQRRELDHPEEVLMVELQKITG